MPRKAKNAPPVEAKPKEGHQPVRTKQYPLKKKDREGIRPLIEKILQLGLLKECEPNFNTPILPLRKPDRSYRVVQDLQAVNKITEDLHPVVANPYTLLTVLTPELTWLTVLDLKEERPSFASLSVKPARKYLRSNGRIPKVGVKPSLLAQCYYPKNIRTASLYLAIN